MFLTLKYKQCRPIFISTSLKEATLYQVIFSYVIFSNFYNQLVINLGCQRHKQRTVLPLVLKSFLHCTVSHIILSANFSLESWCNKNLRSQSSLVFTRSKSAECTATMKEKENRFYLKMWQYNNKWLLPSFPFVSKSFKKALLKLSICSFVTSIIIK